MHSPPVTGHSDDGARPSMLAPRMLHALRQALGLDVVWLSAAADEGDDIHDMVIEHVDGLLAPDLIRPGVPCPSGICPAVDAATAGFFAIADVAAPVRQRGELAGRIRRIKPAVSFLAVVLEDPHGAHSSLLCGISSDPTWWNGSRPDAMVTASSMLAELLRHEDPIRRHQRSVSNRVLEEIASRRMTTMYQPIVWGTSGSIIGVEALTRFSVEPARPDVWFEQAASVGLAVDLEIAAIEQALIGFFEQIDGGPHDDIYLSVNLSPDTLRDPRLAALVDSTRAERLVIEITEHSAITDYSELARALAPLRARGARIAVDDVGAGFASFSHVLEINPDIIKIDLSITRGIDTDPARQALAHAIVDLAERLDAAIVAEGVETQAELETLVQVGVPIAQGYHLARPGPLPLPRITTTATDRPRVSSPKPSEIVQELAARRFELALQHSPIGIALIGLDGTVLHCNPALAAMLGRTERELAELTFQEVTHPDDLHADLELFHECLDGSRDSYRIDKRYITASGLEIWGDLAVVLVRGDGGQPLYFISQIQDVTDRKAMEQDLLRRADRDPLTGMPNRSMAWEHLRAVGATADPARRIGVLFCDLRGFKVINDTHGHRSGDKVIETVSHRLRAAVRPDDLVARWGGDEFLIVVDDATHEMVDALARRIEAAVAAPIHVDDVATDLRLEITVGVAVSRDDEAGDPEVVLHRADADMYRRRGAPLQQAVER